MRAVLVSTYDLGRQPFGLASPAAWLRQEGIETECVDASRDRLTDQQILGASFLAFYLPMHTATRLAAPLIARARRLNPDATIAAYGLYAPLNDAWLRERGVTHVLGPEAERDLVSIATGAFRDAVHEEAGTGTIPRLAFVPPDRTSLPALDRYAKLRMPDGTARVVGSTDATRGCKHLCRHCPIVPVYRGQFRVVPVDVVMEDIRAQAARGAQHISFGDPDFFNGPAHARRILERMAQECPGLSYDVVIKIEHLLAHADMLPLLRETGCLFVTSAVESIDDDVLQKLRKGHTRADFIRAVHACRQAGLTLAPTFVPFNPWTTLEGYVSLLDLLDELDVIENVAPIQLVIRLLITAGSPLLELADVRALAGDFEAASLTCPWRHPDSRVDRLQEEAMKVVGVNVGRPRLEVFDAIAALAREHAGLPARARTHDRSHAVPYMSEPWYCCAEPAADDLRIV